MTSVVIPGLDLVPSLPSRVVTVDLVDMTEGVAVAGAKIDFFLPADLHVPADDKILQAGRVTLTLNASGHGEIRLPAYTDTVHPVDWVIGVKKHWAPHPYYIRVPAGSTAISLADIPAVQTLPQGVVDWMITGASATVTQGSQWDASLNLTGGILHLGLTVPPGGEAWSKGNLTAQSDIDNLSSGTYFAASSATATALGLPIDQQCTLVTYSRSTSHRTQILYGGLTAWSIWIRNRVAAGWRPWEKVAPIEATTLTSESDVDNLPEGPYYVRSGAIAAALNLPDELTGYINVHGEAGAEPNQQIFTPNSRTPRSWLRARFTSGWTDWAPLAAQANPAPDTANEVTAHAVLWGSSTPAGIVDAVRDVFADYGVGVQVAAVGGQWSSQTEFSTGARTWPFTVAGGSIPATGSVSVVPQIALKRDGANLLPTRGWIAGVHGTITGAGTGGTADYTFTRTRPGKARSASGTQQFDVDVTQHGGLHIISTGKNDVNVGATQANLDEVIAARDRILAHWESIGVDYLILGHFINTGTGTSEDRRTLIDADNTDAATKHPDNYLSMKTLVTGTEVWDWTGITPTSEDLSEQALGNLPPSLKGSGNHLNDPGKEFLAYKIAQWARDRDLIGGGRPPLMAKIGESNE